ncbi:TetR/AcrR family transcriptional regulator [Streptomyces acidiscabies]|uniref:TetR/AcrR family transcriptional regulator n=1 Tax=Streptomyces acidiscabies TaxID=42234 RepID=A0AAP6BLW6_9ACTN|nr:TetR/AcrR family transcriptional regulator [Streptomyces acidiscabies]MBP5936623.1 TetR/AcrR family transcriptional regulator [Streptomyces sp. LBUM 1476]MBZ3915381.1 TetR/AcrR family transcriptional regulator [Streptomyces acidiscabies]MDX2967080.1 TetR/AcrR family transcriptional regulator [Streptomyces acidiscabies]MDX3025059.1 TetR/AcrR family transcriptional regulator [Streptomyces acidiscabies]MDX3795358.1 TetR/AcrR family transcriptional regulator [Streptomyces acidiscabies]
MGHREDLLEGAKRCLLTKGFVRTTARDIVKESGTNLASIGYHYGSKDALLAQAYVGLVEGMSDAFEGPELTSPPGSLERFEEVWTNVVATMKEPASLWSLSMEIVVMGDQLPQVRDELAKAQREGSRGFVALLAGVPEADVTDDTADTLGAFYTTLMLGLIAQWRFDPKSAPDGKELTEGLRRLMAAADPK